MLARKLMKSVLVGGVVELVPILTDFTGPGVIVSSYDYYNNDLAYAPWKVFDASAATFWSSTTVTDSLKWIKVEFSVAKVVTQIDTWNIATNNYGYATAVLEYSDDNVGWATGATMTGSNITTKITNLCTHAVAHKYWRFRYVTTLGGGPTTGQIQQMQLWGY